MIRPLSTEQIETLFWSIRYLESCNISPYYAFMSNDSFHYIQDILQGII